MPRKTLLVAGGGGGIPEPEMITDVRQYNTTPTVGGGVATSPLYNTIEDAGSGLYARVIRATPGLMQWWRMGTAHLSFAESSSPPYFVNSAGPTTLWTPSGTVSVGAALLTGDTTTSADLAGGYLEAFDYRAVPSALEVMTAEIWVNFDSLQTDTGLMGEWKTNDGWMLYSADGNDLSLYAGDAHLDAADALTSGELLHIVGVWGGQQGPHPDYDSKLYINGVEVASGPIVATTGSTNNLSTRFQVGQYADGGGGHNLDGQVQDVAVYSRMLQPDEVTQHYQAGLGAVWP